MVESTKKAVADQLERAAIKAGAGGSALDARRAAEVKKQKEAQAAIEREMAALLRSSVKQPPLAPGVDPKSVLCEFFKAGCCEKGARCKYAHDLAVGRKAAKIDLYSDRRVVRQ
jgi:hypothetical protein